MQRTVQLLAVTYYLEFSRACSLRHGQFHYLESSSSRFDTSDGSFVAAEQFIVIYIEIKSCRGSARGIGVSQQGHHKNIFRRFPRLGRKCQGTRHARSERATRAVNTSRKIYTYSRIEGFRNWKLGPYATPLCFMLPPLRTCFSRSSAFNDSNTSQQEEVERRLIYFQSHFRKEVFNDHWDSRHRHELSKSILPNYSNV